MMEANHINNENNRMRSSSWMKLGVIVSVLSAIVKSILTLCGLDHLGHFVDILIPEIDQDAHVETITRSQVLVVLSLISCCVIAIVFVFKEGVMSMIHEFFRNKNPEEQFEAAKRKSDRDLMMRLAPWKLKWRRLTTQFDEDMKKAETMEDIERCFDLKREIDEINTLDKYEALFPNFSASISTGVVTDARDKAETEKEAAVKEAVKEARDKAEAEKVTAVKEALDKAEAEKGAAVKEARDKAAAEKEAALLEAARKKQAEEKAAADARAAEARKPKKPACSECRHEFCGVVEERLDWRWRCGGHFCCKCCTFVKPLH
jgi:hypothetical protein